MEGRAVLKFPLLFEHADGDGKIVIEMPPRATIVHVHEQSNCPTLWAEVPLHKEVPVQRVFYVVATGQHINSDHAKHVGTVHLGWTVWHVYDAGLVH